MLQSTITGLVSGGVYSAIGVCVVLLYRMIGVLNFAQAAFGVLGAFVCFVLFQGGSPVWLAVSAGVVTSLAVSAVIGAAMTRWFSESRVEVRSTVSIAVLIGTVSVGFWIFGDHPRPAPNLLPPSGPQVGGVVIPGTAIGTIVYAAALALAVALVLNRTTIGLRLRAIAQRPSTAELLGIPAQRLAVAVWSVSGAASSLAIMLVAPSRTASFDSLSLLVVSGLAAGLIGGYQSLGLTVAGGLLVGLLEGAFQSVDSVAPYRGAIAILVIIIVLLYRKRKEAWDASR